MRGPKRETDIRIVGGCPCNFWSAWNCRYVRAMKVCDYRGPEPEQVAVIRRVLGTPTTGGGE